MNEFTYLDQKPTIDSKATLFHGAKIVGDVTLKAYVNVWFNATIRGDMASVEIGERTNIQDNVVIHTNTDLPTVIGEDVTVGHSAMIHAATVKNHALIGMGSIILDGAIIGEYAMVGAGCLVPPGKIVPDRTLVVGNPMRIVRELTPKEIESNHQNVLHYLQMTNAYRGREND